eukprot:TRINITY_DN13086_c0_g1_i1.p1 TRINITY_DN13086_c0_g1~~TRINITY_DN13086_c0_g1_i1.p1  ORF type:complete len:302 (-),score=76.77 TRINITY_DN13086_c0_g1_i1:167-1072(-)
MACTVLSAATSSVSASFPAFLDSAVEGYMRQVLPSNAWEEAGGWSAVRSEGALFSLGTWAVTVGAFWALAAFYWAVERSRWFEHRKVQPGKHPDPALEREALLLLLVNHLLRLPVLFFLVYPLAKYAGMHFSLSLDTLPPVPVALSHLLVMWAANETIFYWAHRALHAHPALYRAVHKKHHRFTVPSALSAEFAHPLEELVATSLPTIAPGLLLRTHLLLLWAWLAYRIFEAVEGHSGYDMPSIHSWIHPHAVDFHDWHHSKNSGNYGGMLPWDSWMGTDVAWKGWMRRRENPSAATKKLS